MSAKFPPKWSNQRIELFHGTVEENAASILSGGADTSRGRRRADFGRGFYTTTWLSQARAWALDKEDRHGGRASVVNLSLDRLALRSLRALAFVRGTPDATDFWSFVARCRDEFDEAYLTGEYYDVVYGPVASQWRPPYNVHPGMDQVSFHGTAAQSLLNDRSVCKVEVIE